jgi:hypothetical protein
MTSSDAHKQTWYSFDHGIKYDVRAKHTLEPRRVTASCGNKTETGRTYSSNKTTNNMPDLCCGRGQGKFNMYITAHLSLKTYNFRIEISQNTQKCCFRSTGRRSTLTVTTSCCNVKVKQFYCYSVAQKMRGTT